MTFSILQVSRDRENGELLLSDIYPVWFTVRNITVLKQWCLTAAHVRDHSTNVICFVHKRWLSGFGVTLVITYSETDR